MARRARGAQVIHIYKISLLLNLFYWKKNPPTPCAPRSLPILKVRLRSNPEEYSPVDIWQPSQFSKNFIYFSRFSYRALLAFSFSVFDYFGPPLSPPMCFAFGATLKSPPRGISSRSLSFSIRCFLFSREPQLSERRVQTSALLRGWLRMQVRRLPHSSCFGQTCP